MSRKKPLLVNIGKGLSMLIGLPTITSWKTGDRPKKPVAGTFGFNLQTNSLEYWNGSLWLTAPMEKA